MPPTVTMIQQFSESPIRGWAASAVKGAVRFVVCCAALMLGACQDQPTITPSAASGQQATAPSGSDVNGDVGNANDNDPSDDLLTGVVLETETSAIEGCYGRVFMGVDGAVRAARANNLFILKQVDLMIPSADEVTNIAAFACEGGLLHALVDIGDPDERESWRPGIASIELIPDGGFSRFKINEMPKTSSLTYAGDIEATEGHLWVTTYDPGFLRVFDTSVPTLPREIASLELPANYTASGWKPELAVGDGVAFVATGTSVLVIDISNPSAPTFLANVDAPGDPMGELAEDVLSYALDVVAEGRAGLAAGPDGVWSIIQEEGTGEWRAGGSIIFKEGDRHFVGLHDGKPGIERLMPSSTGEVWASVYEEIDMRLPAAPVLAAAAGLQTGYARHLVLLENVLFAVRHDGSVDRVAGESLSPLNPMSQ